ncbi:peptidoglycan DD-metalloendopeptidase family protein [Paracoccus sp. 1_MG-2023]|uniref:murein hydrolase activator EnvC family protein n=1 Tax=unclassified Paracoccus (in: a-proteobacteria) TaxID=2688777 RepID=UPI001C0A2CEC|nr:MULTISPECIES: peptidoglycan DD-metalloendopeptidase family protein [unclassified Paracoccus (in: a-proteobacteria)]MBU2956842.1 peptidoglycan DD-metalloendopeptidase family protein [Paracoccus sp. C2R09]MDO6670227.1 peptidoglycan DD-metalloendopeptidase family protein [Paracoccus sp. 1_MG-2023]
MKFRFALTLAVTLGMSSGLAAQTASQAVEDAEEAAALLRAAVAELPEAVNADDQVVAMTDVIRAYELGLSALRGGLRQASLREAELRDRFEAQRGQLSRVLGAMTSMQDSPETAMLLHPAGALANARSAMILSAVTPGLRAQAEDLQADLDEIAIVRELQTNAAGMLESGLASMQEARRLLVSASGDRSSMPTRYGEDPAELSALQEAASSLDEFAVGIARMETDIGAPMEDFEGAQGSLRLPAIGTILRTYDEPDAAGVSRPGWVIATAPAALVQTPWPATIRYRGPFLDYGNVMIVEPARGYLLIFAGLSQVFGEVGDVLKAGDPVGLMGGSEAPAQEFGSQFVADAKEGGAAGRSETLYLELRRGNETLDPAEWFVLNPIVEPQQD